MHDDMPKPVHMTGGEHFQMILEQRQQLKRQGKRIGWAVCVVVSITTGSAIGSALFNWYWLTH